MRVMILVTHLMGSGHFVRMLALARALKAAGGTPLIVSGGRPLPHVSAEGVEVVQLPPLSSDGLDYRNLLTAAGERADAAYYAERERRALNALHAFHPDILITELFPFGRRVLAAEFLAVIEAARGMNPRPLVVSSIRDVLEPPSKPARVDEAAGRIAALYDRVLIHGDESFLPLAASWPAPESIAGKLIYTGYVSAPPETSPWNGKPDAEVVVAVGGGAIGRRLLNCALDAAAADTRRWRLLTGGAEAEPLARDLKARAPEGADIVVEPARPDYTQLLADCACSVSLAGYNTVQDLLRIRPPAVVIPMDEGGEREQIIRAEALKLAGLAHVSPMADLTPDRLRSSLEAAIANPPGGEIGVDLDGARRSAAILRDLHEERSRGT